MLTARELLALDSLNSEETDHKPHHQEEKPQNGDIGFLNDGLLFVSLWVQTVNPA